METCAERSEENKMIRDLDQESDPQVLRIEIYRLRQKLRDADRMARAIDILIERNALDARSLPADARLDYGDPYKYEFSQ